MIYIFFEKRGILKHACFLTDVNSVEDNTILFSNHLREQFIAIIDIKCHHCNKIQRLFFFIKVVGHPLVCCYLHSVPSFRVPQICICLIQETK